MAAEQSAGEGAEAKAAAASSGRMLSLKDIERDLGISYPTLLRYKNDAADRIPSTGEGRFQRFPEEALAVFEEIYVEKNGRKPKKRKTGTRKGKKKAGRKKAGAGLLSLKEIQRRTGISYPTLRKYAEKHDAEIPSKGLGRRKRYPEEAIEIFQAIRERRGRAVGPAAEPAPGAARAGRKAKKEGPVAKAVASSSGISAPAERRLERMEKSLERLTQQIAKLEKELKKPLRLVR